MKHYIQVPAYIVLTYRRSNHVVTYACCYIMHAVQLCGWDIGLEITRSQAQCPVVSVAVTVFSLSKELYSHCSSPTSCINGYISPTSTARISVTSPEGAVQDLERPLQRDCLKNAWPMRTNHNSSSLSAIFTY